MSPLAPDPNTYKLEVVVPGRCSRCEREKDVTIIGYQWDGSRQVWWWESSTYWVKCHCPDGVDLQHIPPELRTEGLAQRLRDLYNKFHNGEGKERSHEVPGFNHPKKVRVEPPVF